MTLRLMSRTRQAALDAEARKVREIMNMRFASAAGTPSGPEAIRVPGRAGQSVGNQ